MPTDNELEEARLKVEKLRLEITALKRDGAWTRGWGRALLVIASLLPAAALVFAVIQFNEQSKLSRQALLDQAVITSATNERTFMNSVLGRQLDLYLQASSAVSTLSSSTDRKAIGNARDNFQQLYWGPLVMFESPEVSLAMKKVRACLVRGNGCSTAELHNLSLELSSSLEKDYFDGWRLSPADYAKRSIDYVAERTKSAAPESLACQSPLSGGIAITRGECATGPSIER
jgi:hypothetical protein